MSASKYLMRVLSQPSKVDEKLWENFYLQEHIPHVVNAGVATRGALFRANNDFALTTKTPSNAKESKLHDVQLSHFDERPADKTFCAVYQTELEDYTQSERLKNVAQTTEMLGEGQRSFHECAEWDVRVYELIQNYDPDNLGESEAPYSLHVQTEPADDEDYHKLYEEEHLDLLHKVPGYRRSQRYRLAKTLQGPPDVPRFLVIHEFGHLDALDGPELRQADSSPWVLKTFGDAKALNVRGFRVTSADFDCLNARVAQPSPLVMFDALCWQTSPSRLAALQWTSSSGELVKVAIHQGSTSAHRLDCVSNSSAGRKLFADSHVNGSEGAFGMVKENASAIGRAYHHLNRSVSYQRCL